MRSTIAIVLAAMLASSMAFARSNTNSGSGVTGSQAASKVQRRLNRDQARQTRRSSSLTPVASQKG